MRKSLLKNKVTINTISKILVKDSNGNYKKLFTVEGDKKESDSSVYFVVWNCDSRDSILKYSYHSWSEDGLVETHIGEDKLRNLSRRFQKPLIQRDRAIFSIHGVSNIDKLASEEYLKEDILVTLKPEYLHVCTYLFYTTQNSLRGYASQHDEIVLHNYKIPTRFTSELNFAVLIQRETLTKIQS